MSRPTTGASPAFQVFVKSAVDKAPFAMQVTPSTTVKELHEKVAAREQRRPDTFFLLGNAKTFTDETQTLGDLNIQSGTTIHMLFRMNGGATRVNSESQH